MTSYLLRPNTTQINGFMAGDTHNRESTIGGGTASPNCGSTHHTNTEVGYSNKLISITRFTNTQPPMYTWSLLHYNHLTSQDWYKVRTSLAYKFPNLPVSEWVGVGCVWNYTDGHLPILINAASELAYRKRENSIWLFHEVFSHKTSIGCLI